MDFHVVTHGDYSEYGIMGVFDNETDAENFRSYHNYDNVETYPANPATPPRIKGDHYYCHCNLQSHEAFVLHRRSNDSPLVSSWQLESYGRPIAAYCTFFAGDMSHANKIAADRVRALKAGSTFAHQTRHEYVTLPRSNGRIPNRATHLDTIESIHKADGKIFTEIARDTERREI